MNNTAQMKADTFVHEDNAIASKRRFKHEMEKKMHHQMAVNEKKTQLLNHN